jgi:hypothetical protein
VTLSMSWSGDSLRVLQLFGTVKIELPRVRKVSLILQDGSSNYSDRFVAFRSLRLGGNQL